MRHRLGASARGTPRSPPATFGPTGPAGATGATGATGAGSDPLFANSTGGTVANGTDTQVPGLLVSLGALGVGDLFEAFSFLNGVNNISVDSLSVTISLEYDINASGVWVPIADAVNSLLLHPGIMTVQGQLQLTVHGLHTVASAGAYRVRARWQGSGSDPADTWTIQNNAISKATMSVKAYQ